MSIIRLKGLSKGYETNLLFRELFFSLDRGDRVGLVGKNGSGKTTLLKLILGQEEPDGGHISIDRGLQIGYFSQFSELHDEISVQEVLEKVSASAFEIESALGEIDQALAEELSPEALDALLLKQAALFEEMDRIDGWDARLRIETVLTKLGFNDAHRTRPVGHLSSGWRNRAALAKILLESPDILLLDEPTNYLDIGGLIWLEGWLHRFNGALLLISHDRHFLDQVVTKVVDIEDQGLTVYEGGLSHYISEKHRRFKRQGATHDHEDALLIYEAQAMDRRDKISKRKRRPLNLKKKKGSLPVDRIIRGVFQELVVPNILCTVEGFEKSYGDQRIFFDLSFELRSRDRLAVLGPNGCGKSTLFRAITGLECPDKGSVQWGVRENVVFSHYNALLDALDPEESVSHALNAVKASTAAPKKSVAPFLDLMLLSSLSPRQKIGQLSGGQRARVALAQCFLSGAQVILLDEPTNHLDILSTQLMERALHHFPGAVIVVSHDRYFIDKIANRMLVFAPEGRTHLVKGGWSRAQRSRE